MHHLTVARIGLILTSFIWLGWPLAAQQPPGATQSTQQATGQQRTGQPAARMARATQNQAVQKTEAVKAPFAPLSADEQRSLDQVLQAWQNTTSSTKTLEADFIKFHYDNQSAPSGTPATKGQGLIKYANPDRGLIRVDTLVFFSGKDATGTGQYEAHDGQFGEHWVCDGKRLIEYDYNQKQCKIQDLPKEVQGKNIISSPLPFVFGLDARRMKERFWVRQVPSPNPEATILEVHPKRSEDRAQYRMVMVALDAKRFEPKALIMYAPNFDPKTAAVYDHYEFTNVKRNGWSNRMGDFMGNFIPKNPPAGWKVIQLK